MPEGTDQEQAGRVLSDVDHYGRIPWGLLADPDVADAEKVAYAYLTTWDFARTGRMFQRREDLAGPLGWSVRKLDGALMALERRGAIRRVRRGPGRSNDIELLAETRSMMQPAVAALCDTNSQHDATTARENTRENQEELTRVQEEFEGWYWAYPRKVGKGDALKAYRRARSRGATREELVAALDNYVDDIKRMKTETQFVKHPSSFLNGDRWRDYRDGGQHAGAPPPVESVYDRVARQGND